MEDIFLWHLCYLDVTLHGQLRSSVRCYLLWVGRGAFLRFVRCWLVGLGTALGLGLALGER